jgi:chromosome partitioning protein
VTQVIAFVNQKGGVGKTSCCLHLAGALAELGHSVCMVDNDPQASLTQALLGPLAASNLTPEETVVTLYSGEADGFERIPVPTGMGPGGWLVPGSPQLFRLNVEVDPDTPPDWLGRFVASVLSYGVDYVLIDNPPNLLGCTWSALAAADGVVVPITADDFGTQGITPVNAAMAWSHNYLNPRLALLGYLVTRYRPRLRLARDFLAALRGGYAGDVFDATVPDLAAYGEALNARLPIARHAPRSPAAAAMHAAALELLVRLEQSATSPVVVD